MAHVFKMSNQRSKMAFSFFIGLVALFFSMAPAAFAVAVDQTIHGSNPTSGTYYNTTGNNTTFVAPNTLNVNAGTTLRGLNIDGKNGGNFVLKGNTVNIHGAVDVSAFYGKNGFAGNGGSVNIDAHTVFVNGMIKADGINGGLINIPNAGNVTVGCNAQISATGVGGNAGQVMIRGANGVTLAAGSIVEANGKPVAQMNNVDIKGSIVNIDGIVRANGIVKDGGKIAIVAYGPSKNGNVTIGSTGKVQANGACGECTKGDGGNAGEVTITSNCGAIKNDGVIEAKGGHGFASHVTEVANLPQGTPSNGGNGGLVSLNYRNRLDTKVGQVDVTGGKGGSAIANCAIETGNPGNGGAVVITGPNANTLDTTQVALAGGTAGFGDVIKTGQTGTLTTIGQDVVPCATCGDDPGVVGDPNPPVPVVVVPATPIKKSMIPRFLNRLPFLGPNAGLDLMRKRVDDSLKNVPPVEIVNNVPRIPNAVLVRTPKVQPPVNMMVQPFNPVATPAPAPKNYVRGYW
jgi:hypothetical protein